jgi:hypothetical protein
MGGSLAALETAGHVAVPRVSLREWSSVQVSPHVARATVGEVGQGRGRNFYSQDRVRVEEPDKRERTNHGPKSLLTTPSRCCYRRPPEHVRSRDDRGAIMIESPHLITSQADDEPTAAQPSVRSRRRRWRQ